jgi:hypothetical protein
MQKGVGTVSSASSSRSALALAQGFWCRQQSGGHDRTGCTGRGTNTCTRRASDDRSRRRGRHEHSHRGRNAGGRPGPQAHGHRRRGEWQK